MMKKQIIVIDEPASNDATAVYNAICRHLKDNGYPPTYREIGKLSSMSHTKAREVVLILEEMGYVKIEPKKTRTIIPLRVEEEEVQKLLPSPDDGEAQKLLPHSVD